MTLDELLNVMLTPQEQETQTKVKEDFERLQDAFVSLLDVLYPGEDEQSEEPEQESTKEAEKYSFDDILKQNLDVLQRLKNCDDNTYKSCGCCKAPTPTPIVATEPMAAEPVAATNQSPTLTPSKYSHWIIKYLFDNKGAVYQADYEYLRHFCEFVMNQ